MSGHLTAAEVRAITKPGRHADGGTLYLFVTPGGSKSWVQRLTIDGRRCDLGLGGWPLTARHPLGRAGRWQRSYR